VGGDLAYHSSVGMSALLGQQAPPGAPADQLTMLLARKTRSELYEYLTQMQGLLAQNPAQARQILLDNPQLTRALFMMEIILGMVGNPLGDIAPKGAAPLGILPPRHHDQGAPPAQAPPMEHPHQHQHQQYAPPPQNGMPPAGYGPPGGHLPPPQQYGMPPPQQPMYMAPPEPMPMGAPPAAAAPYDPRLAAQAAMPADPRRMMPAVQPAPMGGGGPRPMISAAVAGPPGGGVQPVPMAPAPQAVPQPIAMPGAVPGMTADQQQGESTGCSDGGRAQLILQLPRAAHRCGS
jgi:hypothetical protein